MSCHWENHLCWHHWHRSTHSLTVLLSLGLWWCLFQRERLQITTLMTRDGSCHQSRIWRHPTLPTCLSTIRSWDQDSEGVSRRVSEVWVHPEEHLTLRLPYPIRAQTRHQGPSAVCRLLRAQRHYHQQPIPNAPDQLTPRWSPEGQILHQAGPTQRLSSDPDWHSGTTVRISPRSSFAITLNYLRVGLGNWISRLRRMRNDTSEERKESRDQEGPSWQQYTEASTSYTRDKTGQSTIMSQQNISPAQLGETPRS